MEFRQIKELMQLMGKTGIDRLRIKEDNFELELEREGLYSEDKNDMYDAFLPPEEARTLNKGNEALSPMPRNETISGKCVTSPMVGTFYASPSPDDPAFVKVGDMVTEGTIVCIVEAMKVMNEVKAGVSGKISKVLVESGHPVEFGTKLFVIE
jgi:acetyl-CoA carboxylase biotin carboxyl carrier protein